MPSCESPQLHSRYNPQAEAQRYINSLNLDKDIECFLLIEPGMGYMVPFLQDQFKNSKIICLHIEKRFPSQGVPSLCGIDGREITRFLNREIPDTDISRIRIIEWRPSMNYYREDYVKLLSQVVFFLKQKEAEKRTTEAFGKKWVRNFFKNLDKINNAVLYSKAEIPVIITGSGPGLEKSIPLIKEMRENVLIISCSSSISAMNHNGVNYDMAIATDGGNWALQHIYPFFRNDTGSGVLTAERTGENNSAFFAASLFAALPSQCRGTPLLILNEGLYWQNIILHALNIPSVIVPQKGTVSACAIELALQITDGNIYLAGVDLRVNDIRSHARPYGFDYILANKASRFTPVYSQAYVRSNLIKNGGSMDIYAAWYKNEKYSWPERIFSFGNPSQGEEGIFKKALPEKRKLGKNEKNLFKQVKTKEKSASFRERGLDILLSAMEEKSHAQNIREELCPLLFPGEKKVPPKELANALKEAARPR